MVNKPTKNKIMEIATALFAEHGYAGTSTRDICNAANINISLISYYFGGKEKLYDEIVRDGINKQTEFLSQFLDFDMDIESLEPEQKIDELRLFVDKMTDFIYKEISRDAVILFLREQQSITSNYHSMMNVFLRRLVAAILSKDENTKDVIYASIFLISQIAFPFIMQNSSLLIFGQNSFEENDIQIIKQQANKYITSFFKI